MAAIPDIEIPAWLVEEWGFDHAAHVMEAIKRTCSEESGREVDWKLGPNDRIFRIVERGSNA